MVTRLARVPVEQRLEMLAAFEKPSEEEGDPFLARSKVREMSSEQFEQAYVAWLDRHPEWK
jgi:hypothetical protein